MHGAPCITLIQKSFAAQVCLQKWIEAQRAGHSVIAGLTLSQQFILETRRAGHSGEAHSWLVSLETDLGSSRCQSLTLLCSSCLPWFMRAQHFLQRCGRCTRGKSSTSLGLFSSRVPFVGCRLTVGSWTAVRSPLAVWRSVFCGHHPGNRRQDLAFHNQPTSRFLAALVNSLPGDQDESVTDRDEALLGWRSFVNQPALVFEWFCGEFRHVSH